MQPQPRSGSPAPPFVWLFLVFALAIAALAYLLAATQAATIKAQAGKQLSDIAELKVRHIAAWRAERESDGRVVQENPLALAAIRRWLAGRDNGATRLELAAWLKTIERHHQYQAAVLLDGRGSRWLPAPPVSPPGQADLESAVTGGSPVFADLDRTSDGQVHQDLLVPMRLGPGPGRTALVLLRVDPGRFLYPLLEFSPLSPTTETLLCRREGDTVVYLSRLRHRRDVPLSFRRPLAGNRSPAAQGASGREGLVETPDYRGVPVMAALRRIPDSSWFLLTKCDLEEIQAPARKFLLLVLALAGTLLAAGGFGLYSLWQRQRARAYRQDYEAEVQRRALTEHYQHLVKHASDVFLLFDAGCRLVEANDRAAALYGYSRSELLELGLNDLLPPDGHAAVAERTARIEAGGDEGLLFESVQQKKDGSRFPVEVSARVITIDGCKFYQVTVRDISRRRRDEERLRLLESVAVNARDAVLVAELRSRHIADNPVVFVNRSFTRLTGWEAAEIAGKTVGAIFESPQEAAEAGRLCAPLWEGRPAEGEVLAPRKDGSRFWAEFAAVPVPGPAGEGVHLVAVARDITERKRSEQALRNSERKYRELVELAEEGIWTIDLEANTTFVNRRMAEMLGYTAAEMLGRHLFRFMDEEWAARAAIYLERLRAGQMERFEFAFLHKSGRRVYTALASTPLLDDCGQFAGGLAVVTDITERRRIEEALRASEERFRIAASHVSDLIIDSNVATGAVEVFGAAQTCREDIERGLFRSMEGWKALLHPEDCDRVLAAVDRQLQAGEPFHQEYRMILPGRGVRHWEVHGALTTDAGGRALRWIGVASDITERKRAEEGLSRLAAIVRSSGDAVIGVGLDAIIQSWNRGAEQLYGYTAEEVEGRHVSLLAPPEDRCEQAELMKRVASGETVRNYETTRVRKDGTTVPVSLTVSPVLTPDGRPVGFAAMARDITEIRQAQHTLQQYTAELQRKNEELAGALAAAREATLLKNRFLANMSHEVRTPMHGVIGITELLLDTPLGAAQREYAEMIRSSAGNLLAILNDILDISKIEAGELQLESVPFDLRAVIEEAAKLWRQQAAGKGLELAVQIGDAIPELVLGDPGRVRQVLTNLMGNAIKFTAQGSVTLSASRESEAGDAVPIRFEVRDTGIGIDPALRPKLFRAFKQGDAATTRKYGGSGLGLAISRELARRMGGDIDFESAPGRGSTFRFTAVFPKVGARPAAPPAAPTGGEPTRAPLNARILLVEDHEVNRRIAHRVLEQEGYTVDDAVNGLRALAAISQTRYDLVLMDVQMPEMDGFEATAQIRRLEASLRHTPIIAMTASAMAGDRERCLAAGMDDYISKPMRRTELVRVVRSWLARK